MKTISAEEFNKKYGTNIPPVQKAPTYGSGVASAFKGGVSKIKEGISEAGPVSGTGFGLFTGVGKILGGATEAITSPLAPPFQATVGKGFEKVVDKISENKKLQNYAKDIPENSTGERILGAVSDYSNVIGTLAGSKTLTRPSLKGKVKPTIQESITSKPGAVETMATNVVKDVIPTKNRLVNTEVTKALDLTQGDVKNIHLKTGNEVGEFLSRENLIGNNVDETTSNIKNFQKRNYDAVRSQIDAVKKGYLAPQVPRYTEALQELKKQIQDTPGLQEAVSEVDTLLNKRNITLGDVQRVKELMDDHFSLYKAVGDVKEGVAKKGLAEIRRDLKKFIEKEVLDTTGIDIEPLNKNVMTSRALTDAIETRSTRGLTRATISAGDIVTFLSGSAFGSPLLGAAAVLAKKVYQSPSFKLKLSKWLDSLDDARRAQIKADLEKGILPPEIKRTQLSGDSSNTSIDSSKPSTALDSQAKNFNSNDSINQSKSIDNKAPISNTSSRTISDTVPQKKGFIQREVDKFKNTPNKQGGFVRLPSKKVVKAIDEPTKAEIYKTIKYLNSDEITKLGERTLSDLMEKFEISPSLSTRQIKQKLSNLLEKTKTN